MIGQGMGEEVVWRRQCTTDSDSAPQETPLNICRFYLSLWGQPRSVTSGDLSWPTLIWRNIHVLTPIYQLSPFKSSHHAKLRLFTISLKSCEGCSSYVNRETWPDQIFFMKGCPISYGKFQHDSKRCGVQLRKTHGGGVASTPPPLTGRGLSHMWWKNVTGAFHDLIFCVAIIVPEIMTGIPDNNHHFSKIWPSITSADLSWRKNDRSDFNGFTEILQSPCRAAF